MLFVVVIIIISSRSTIIAICIPLSKYLIQNDGRTRGNVERILETMHGYFNNLVQQGHNFRVDTCAYNNNNNNNAAERKRDARMHTRKW